MDNFIQIFPLDVSLNCEPCCASGRGGGGLSKTTGLSLCTAHAPHTMFHQQGYRDTV